MSETTDKPNVLTEEEYILWEKAYLAVLNGLSSYRGKSLEAASDATGVADLALVEMRARNPRFHKTGPYR